MGRRKIEIKAIKDDRNRSVTFLKRKGGLFKKAHELSVLCSVDVAVFIFGSNKKLYEYSSCDMRELITRYTYHGGPNEHKGPSDFNGGNDDSDDEGDGTPPRNGEPMEAHIMHPHFQGQAPYQHLRHHTPSASPPIPNGVTFAQHAAQPVIARGHTPQPQIGSRPGSRNDIRRMSQNMVPQQVGPTATPPGPQVNGYAFMPHPAIYNPQQNPPSMTPPMPQQAPQFPYPPPQPHPHMQSYIQDDRRQSLPPSFPPHSAPQVAPATAQRHSVSPPQPHPEQLPHQQPLSHQNSTPQPTNHHMPSPPLPQPQPIIQEPPPPPPGIKSEMIRERPIQPPLLNTEVRKLSTGGKKHSIFTPIDEKRSMLSQHLAAFNEPIKPDTPPKPQPPSDTTAPRNMSSSSPPLPKRHESAPTAPKPRDSVTSIPDSAFTTPSRQNSLRSIPGVRPRLRVEIPDEGSDGAATADSTSPKNSTMETGSLTARRNGTEAHAAGMVLPPPSPSASAILSAGATGPPNPFARPPPHQSNMNIDTPVSALPSRFLNNEFLPSPSSFYPEWNFGSRGDSATLPSPLNFATPVVGTGPSFLRDDNSVSGKRKSPEISTNGPTSDPLDHGHEPKRIKVDS